LAILEKNPSILEVTRWWIDKSVLKILYNGKVTEHLNLHLTLVSLYFPRINILGSQIFIKKL
jgi:hypothetical protein